MHAFTTFVDRFSEVIAAYGLVFLIRSTLICSAGLTAAWLIRRRGAAAESAILRAFLAAFLLSLLIPVNMPWGLLTIKTPTPSGIPVKQESHQNVTLPSGVSGTHTSSSGTLSPQKVDTPAITRILPHAADDKVTDQLPDNNTPVKAAPQQNQSGVVTAMPQDQPNGPQVKSSPVFHLSDIDKLLLSNRIIAGIFAAGWIAVSLYLLIRLLVANISLYYIRRVSFPAKPEFQSLCRSVSRTLGVNPPLVLQSLAVETPIIAGFFRPFILLPINEHEQTLMGKEVFLHELAHLKRRDFFWNQLLLLATALVPFQPLIWILSRRIKETADYVCDDFVIGNVDDRRLYARSLLSFSRHYHVLVHENITGVGFLSFASPLRKRVGRILDESRGIVLHISNRFAAVITIVCCSVISLCALVRTSNYTSEASERPGKERLRSPLQTAAFIPPLTLSNVEYTAIGATEAKAGSPDRMPIAESASPGILSGGASGTASRPVKETAGESEFSESRAETAAENTPLFRKENTSSGFGKPESDTLQAAVGHTQSPNGAADTDAESPAVSLSSGDYHAGGTEKTADVNPDTADNGIGERSAVETTDELLPGEKALQAEAQTGPSYNSSSAPAIPVAMNNSIELPSPAALNVTVEYDYTHLNVDFSSEEDKHLYALYMGLDKMKSEPAWSPDGKLIAFTDNNRLWIVSSEGGAPRLIFENFNSGYPVGTIDSICFTPDGKKITFRRDLYDTSKGSTINKTSMSNVIFTNPIPVIESIDLTTGDREIITENGYSCAWSPDGRYLCYLVWDNQNAFDTSGMPVLYDSVTGETTFLDVDRGKRYGKPDFSPDGSHVIIPARTSDGPIEFYSIPLSGGNMEQITSFESYAIFGKYRNNPEYSPDGQWILFTDYTWVKNKPDKRLYLIHTETGSIIELFENAENSNSMGKWSPDGTKICYLSETKERNYIYIYEFSPEAFGFEKPALTEEKTPLAFALSDNRPNPFNASTTLTFTLPSTGAISLAVYNATGQKVRELVSGAMSAGVHNIVWDGRDDDGRIVASGTYISLLRSGGRSARNKMSFIK